MAYYLLKQAILIVLTIMQSTDHRVQYKHLFYLENIPKLFFITLNVLPVRLL